LTPESVADLRLPIILSSFPCWVLFVVAWILREAWDPIVSEHRLALGMVGFILAAHIAHDVLNPTLRRVPWRWRSRKACAPRIRSLCMGIFVSLPA